jgi:hypothetical protein
MRIVGASRRPVLAHLPNGRAMALGAYSPRTVSPIPSFMVRHRRMSYLSGIAPAGIAGMHLMAWVMSTCKSCSYAAQYVVFVRVNEGD